MKHIRKELLALMIGFLVAYAWQLFSIILCYIFEPQEGLIAKTVLIPNLKVQFLIMPIISWVLMGIFKVKWYSIWLNISLCIMALLSPFAAIISIAYALVPYWLYSRDFWLGAISISLSFMIIMVIILIYEKMKEGIKLPCNIIKFYC